MRQKIVFIISRRTSANRSVKQHADNGNQKPLCNDQPKGWYHGWSWDYGTVTCEKCLEIQKEQK